MEVTLHVDPQPFEYYRALEASFPLSHYFPRVEVGEPRASYSNPSYNPSSITSSIPSTASESTITKVKIIDKGCGEYEMCMTLNVAMMPPSPHIYGQPSHFAPKEEDKTITLNSNNMGSNTFWSLGTWQDQPHDDISQWIYREEPESSPPFIEYFQETYPCASKLAKSYNYQGVVLV